MTKTIIAVVGVVIVTCLGLPMLLMSSMTAGGPGGCSVAAPTADPSARPADARRWDSGQLAIAETIVQVGVTRGISGWGQTIAVAVAIQESGLRNLPHLGDRNDHDSIGVFQQRPSQGWGTPEQLADPAYQAGTFYDKLLTVPRWEQMPLTQAAQAVQASAHPDAYARWAGEAVRLVELYSTADGGLGCTTMAFGGAEPAPRNPDGSWPPEECSIHPDPTTGTGCVTPRLLHLVQQAEAAGYPAPSCFRVEDHGEHPLGRACDFMMTPGGEASAADKARGDATAGWAVANADRLGIMYVIWFRMIWTPTEGWHPYTNPWGGDDPSGWHTNHVHISVY